MNRKPFQQPERRSPVRLIFKSKIPPSSRTRGRRSGSATHAEFLILPDGRVLAHNLTPPLARIVAQLNPGDPVMNRRAYPPKKIRYELPR